METLITSVPENLNIPEQMLQQAETSENDEPHSDEVSDYELCREERIRENRERMQKLGIFDLSQKLTAPKPTTVRPYRRKTQRIHSPLPPSSPAPVRRSSRLQSSTPVSYCELKGDKGEKSSKEGFILREEGSRPEVYTEEHEKLLGSAEASWTLFVDGYGKDGKRIYDPIKGKTCHQCRQKTLGHRTHCSQCNMVQGQFCGDCLYMRYGENVLEAKANPDWICPVCRGICNCSLCRQAKGWPPTGMLYKKITNLGYKSAAHYLIQTRRANTDTESNAGSKLPVSAKRSLPFSDIEEDKELGDSKLALESVAEPLLDSDNASLSKDEVELTEPEKDSSGCNKDNEPMALAGNECITVIVPKTAEPLNEAREICDVDEDELPKPEKDSSGCNKEKEAMSLAYNECLTVTEPKTSEPLNEAREVCDVDEIKEVKSSSKSSRKRVRCEPPPDTIAGRLRMRHKIANASE